MSRPSYRFYIVDLFDGAVRGTDQPDVALDHSVSEDHFVIDTVGPDNDPGAAWIVNHNAEPIEPLTPHDGE